MAWYRDYRCKHWTMFKDYENNVQYGIGEDKNWVELQPIKFPNQKRDTSIFAYANQPIDKFLENELSANTPKPVLWTIITVFLMIFTTTGVIFLISNYEW